MTIEQAAYAFAATAFAAFLAVVAWLAAEGAHNTEEDDQ